MTTIFSNNEDIDSEMLMELFSDIPGNNIVEIKYSMISSDWRTIVENAIANENDTLIICGHGSPDGLFFPGFEDFIIHNLHVDTIHAKKVICVWCHASSFVKRFGLHNCIASGMFISNVIEAYVNRINDCDQDYINNTVKNIYAQFKSLICSDVPINEYPKRIFETIDNNNKIDLFNRNKIIFNP